MIAVVVVISQVLLGILFYRCAHLHFLILLFRSAFDLLVGKYLVLLLCVAADTQRGK